MNSIGLWLAESGGLVAFAMGSVIALVLVSPQLLENLSILNDMDTTLYLLCQQTEILPYVHHFLSLIYLCGACFVPAPLPSVPFPIAPHPAWITIKMVLFNRPDANQGNLRSAAYEALMELIKNSAKVGRVVKEIQVERGFSMFDGEGSMM